MLVFVHFSGQNLVPKPPLQVQEVVEKWRNSPRATCCFQWISPLHVSANYCLGLSTYSKNEQCQLQFTSEQQPSQHDCAFILFGKLLLVLNHELYHASAASSGPAPPQLRHKRRDDILKEKNKITSGLNRTILVKKKCQYFHLQTSCVRRRSLWIQTGSWTFPVFALANVRHRFLQLFLYLFILFMSRDEWTTISQSNHSLQGESLLLRGRHFLTIPATTTTTCHKCSTS